MLPMNFWLSERLNCGLSFLHCTRRLPRKRDMSAVVSRPPAPVADASMLPSTDEAMLTCGTSR